MAAKKKSKTPSSKPGSSGPGTDEASTESDKKSATSAKPTAKTTHAIDPGAIKLYSPVGPLMWMLIPLVLCIVIALLKS